MKQFNLERAKAGDAVCTRNGMSVRIICYDMKAEGFPIVALIRRRDGSELGGYYTEEGRCFLHSECERDLMMKD